MDERNAAQKIVEAESGSGDSTSTARSDSAKIIEIESGGDDVFSTLDDIVEHPAKTWTARALPKDADPKEWVVSDRVTGVVEYLEGRESEFGPYVMAELRQKSGERVQAHLFGTVLKKWGPVLRVGDGIAIAYLGTRPSTMQGGKDYDNFEVIVVRDGRRVSQSRVLGETDEPAAESEEESGDLPMARGA
jgi:hypothetical protein